MEEETNNQPLTAREVAAANPELDQLRQIAFGENYLDDIDAGTGTARFYSGFGMQPDYLNTAAATEQAVADAVAAEAEAAAAPVIETEGEDQVTGDLGLDTTFQDAGATDVPGTIGTLGNLTTPTKIDQLDYTDAPVIVPALDLSGTSEELIDQGVIETPQEFYGRTYNTSPSEYDLLDQEEQNLVDQQYGTAYGLSSAVEPATSINFNPLTTAANLITGGITDIPFVGTAVQKAADYFTGDGNDSVASTTTPTMGDPMVDAEENQPTPLETATGIIQDPMTGDAQIAEEIASSNRGETSSDSGFSSSDQGETSSDSGFSDSSDFGGYDSGGYDPAPSPQEDPTDRGGGGGGGGGGKIVCTMMNETYGFGSFRNKIWQKYAKDNLTREHEKGYHKLFLPLVKLSKTNIVIRKILEHIAVHRTIDIRQEARGKTHILGRVYRKVLEPICYLVGKYGKR